MSVVTDILVSPRNALEGFDKADGTLDSQVMSLHNLVHSFLNGTNALPHSAANDPIFVVCQRLRMHEKFLDNMSDLLFSIQLRFGGVLFSVEQRDVCKCKLISIYTIEMVRWHLKALLRTHASGMVHFWMILDKSL